MAYSEAFVAKAIGAVSLGVVKVDGVTLKVSPDGVLSKIEENPEPPVDPGPAGPYQNSSITFAGTNYPGILMPDNETIKVSDDGVLYTSSAMPPPPLSG